MPKANLPTIARPNITARPLPACCGLKPRSRMCRNRLAEAAMIEKKVVMAVKASTQNVRVRSASL